MKKPVFLSVLLLGLFLFSLPAAAVQPNEILSDPGLEQRARDITRGLRCLVCQGEDIDDSEAPLAADLRRLVRERLEAGDDDDAVIRYVTDRYGDRVLMRPPLKTDTLLLWGAPALVLGAGAWLVFSVVRRQNRGKSAGGEE